MTKLLQSIRDKNVSHTQIKYLKFYKKLRNGYSPNLNVNLNSSETCGKDKNIPMNLKTNRDEEIVNNNEYKEDTNKINEHKTTHELIDISDKSKQITVSHENDISGSSQVKFSNWSFSQYLVAAVAAILVYTIHQHQLWTHQGFSKFWLNWENLDLEAEVVSNLDIYNHTRKMFRYLPIDIFFRFRSFNSYYEQYLHYRQMVKYCSLAL